MSTEINTAGTYRPAEKRHLRVTATEAIAYTIIIANAVNLYFSRLGAVPDVLLLGVTIPAFLWTVSEGIDIRRIRFFLIVVASMIGIYVLYSGARLSLQGFRNAAALFTVTATFLFYFRASNLLTRSTGFLIALIIALGTFIFLWHTPFSVTKNNINAAMCYYLIAIFMCYPGLRKIRTRHITLLFFLIFSISALNGHRTLAGSSILVLLQYYVLSMNVRRTQLRFLMYVGLITVVSGVIALLASPRMSEFALAFNTVVTSEGGRTLMSGRQILWPIVWQAIVAHPVLGMGPGTVLGDIYSTTLSAHNLYLQVGLQIGFVGFAMLVLLFWSLWRAARPIGPPATRNAENLMTAVITMVIVHSLFAVFLLQNALVVAVPVWMVLGLGLGALAREASIAGPERVAVMRTTPYREGQHA